MPFDSQNTEDKLLVHRVVLSKQDAEASTGRADSRVMLCFVWMHHGISQHGLNRLQEFRLFKRLFQADHGRVNAT